MSSIADMMCEQARTAVDIIQWGKRLRRIVGINTGLFASIGSLLRFAGSPREYKHKAASTIVLRISAFKTHPSPAAATSCIYHIQASIPRSRDLR